MRRDVASAYLASGIKVLAWAWISRITFIDGDASQFAILALVRSTIGLLNYTTLGLAPAMIHSLARATADSPDDHTNPPKSPPKSGRRHICKRIGTWLFTGDGSCSH